MRRFWADGFGGTSVRDLGEAMGLGQASVYNAFGDKRALFTRCLDQFRPRRLSTWSECCLPDRQECPPSGGIRPRALRSIRPFTGWGIVDAMGVGVDCE